ncbi:MAG: hypothetical protein WCO11_00190 [Sphingomonadales bacterium]|jgi:hypothetical protein
MEFKFVPNQKPGKVDVTTLRRQKLVRRIDQQVGFVRSMIEGHNPRGSWVWMDETGTYFVPIKYGRHSLELKKEMFSVQCQDLDEVEHVLCTFRGMVLNGDLDDHLTKTSTEIRKRFGK